MKALKKMSTSSTLIKILNSFLKNELPVFIIGLLLSLHSFHAFSQDPSYSQFTTNMLYSNPGYIGSSGNSEILIHYRRYQTQNPAKFENLYFSFGYPLYNDKSKIGLGGVGIQVFQNNEGEAYLKTSNIGVPFSTRIKTGDKFHVQFGLMPSIVLKSLNWQNLKFTNQFDKITGYNPDIAVPPWVINNSGSIPPFVDLSFGFYGIYNSNESDKRNIEDHVLEMGIAMHHWPVTVNESFINRYAPLPYKLVGVFKYAIPFSKKSEIKAQLQPAIIYERQGPLSTTMIKASFIKEAYMFGFGIRNEQKRMLSFNNFTFEFGYTAPIPESSNKVWLVNFSLDVPVNSETLYVNTAFEISLRLIFIKVRDCRDCPSERW